VAVEEKEQQVGRITRNETSGRTSDTRLLFIPTPIPGARPSEMGRLCGALSTSARAIWLESPEDDVGGKDLLFFLSMFALACIDLDLGLSHGPGSELAAATCTSAAPSCTIEFEFERKPRRVGQV
jgi:hypothetical protein